MGLRSEMKLRAMQVFGSGEDGNEAALRRAAWVARCVGRGEVSPLGPQEISALASLLRTRRFAPGEPMFGTGGEGERSGIWIIQTGRVELAVGSGNRRSVVYVLHPGDVEGDVQHLLGLSLPYVGRALDEVTTLYLDNDGFERLLAEHQAIGRRWLSSVAQRLLNSHQRVIGLLGRSLRGQVARLLLDEAVDGDVMLPQRTVAALLGVQRPSLNRILKDFERRGLIEVGYGSIAVRDAAGLGKVVD